MVFKEYFFLRFSLILADFIPKTLDRPKVLDIYFTVIYDKLCVHIVNVSVLFESDRAAGVCSNKMTLVFREVKLECLENLFLRPLD